MAHIPGTVALRDRSTGRYLAAGGWWSDDEAAALWVDNDDATEVRRRFTCEPAAIELVEAEPDRGRAVA
ncbi:MAG TPA: hypothetical protein VM143_08400 [Acidimicrobiales bacterium]|nr:hypothetical protein [Acidimicrobiales bacterium]